MEHTACLKPSKDVEFQDVYYTVKERKHYIKVTGTRQILRGVSGSFRNGQLSAIMGPSGAGKSSLLNALSGLRTSDVKGHIKIERKGSCYITQEDNHQTLLTVEELMTLSCNLKLPHCNRKAEIITEILENLHLNHRRNVYAEKLSGGERKRLSIALELVANPNIFFLDEPTSGLDEVTAAQCIRLLSQLAKEGRTIVCTIHQPSATIFNYFDSIFVLASGQCVYQGQPGAVIPFLRHVHIECPKYYSPSDYIIELCDADEGKLIPVLSELTDNGKLIYAPQQLNGLSNTTTLTVFQQHSKDFQQSVRTFFVEEPKRSRWQHFLSAGTNFSTDGTLIGGVTAFYEHLKTFTKLLDTEQEDTSSLHQFCVLFKMMLVRIMRARVALLIQFLHHVLTALCFGLIFLNLGNQGSRMFDHLKFCIGIIIIIAYTQVMVPILSYPMEIKIVRKETFNRWYKLTPYYMALNFSRLPLQIILNMIMLTIIYWMSGLPTQLWRFGLFASIGLMTSLIAEGMGLAIGMTFSITNGSAVGPLTIAPLMGLAVYGFDFAAQIPYAMNLLMKFSYIRVAVVALILTVFGFERPELECDEMYCHFGDPRVLLKFLDIEQLSMWYLFSLLTMLMLFYRVLMYLSLRRRCGT
ncbi:ATP-binding cassette subfamily G member 4 isoform X1 [Bactrocera oleae]|uniref:ATP-binding cassette subfamily G member 4 isoform X1 n=2 Tax=Bactrocera oleae TaxID=104688 RepID=UPI0006B85DAA|nr:ATP-binding cassette sub-family G member 4 isoform X1 [Bactrocera oleae]XP_036214435.1 ATP-binding cassette sub-family G member 4 isoform X1 [Bactrocera oleae]XP_036214436.1 ATP-binding cassette sub-family G member 4 isoform X1 [Bactrocera oleae]XP_036214437.1 ATP-binding cassette sub-family G member 4 isoform X1 [Bactrocera oleae]XP_036214438.1 ATP-binding cassette sub-family G member 4 isoform X1 [Bactrocera oleae]XP_036214440.1 ATP-binding cassette sub-family G member 4 isoform X1 [Bactr